jgi:hypothetical protein
LGSRRLLPNACALALGYFTTCAVIGISGLVLFGDAGSAVSTVGWVVGVAVGALLIGLYSATPRRASSMLGSLQAWMGKHNRTITVVICFVLGTFFLVRGLLGA